jgi:hypothetical protein
MASDVTHALCISYSSLNLIDAVIGFVNTNLSILENGGDLEFEIAVLEGDLRFNVLVNFAMANSAALGIKYCIYSPL